MLTAYVQRVVSHYAGRIVSWDVVNEAIDPTSGRDDGLSESPWLELLGPSYIAHAFRAAHNADTKAELVYNENGLEYDMPWSARKRRLTLQLLHSLKQHNVPINALGIQAHLLLRAKFTPDVFRTFLDSVQALGLKVIVTELDVREGDLGGSDAQRDSAVACMYQRFLSTALHHPAVEGVVMWGLSDKFSWIARYFPRSDSRPVRPLPYDQLMRAKPARDVIADALRLSPLR